MAIPSVYFTEYRAVESFDIQWVGSNHAKNKGDLLQQDYAPRNEPTDCQKETPGRPGLARKRMLPILLMMGVGLATVVLLVLSGGQPVSASISPVKEEWLTPELHAKTPQSEDVKRIRLQGGMTAISALNKLGLSTSQVYHALDAARVVYPLKNVHIGHIMSRVNAGNNGMHIYYEIDTAQRLRLDYLQGGQWQAAIEKREIQNRLVQTAGHIGDSFFVAAEKAGLDDTTAMNLVDIFSWDIDFARDIRAGDSFRVLYQEHYGARGQMIGTTILAAEFTNQGNTFKAVRFEISPGHYEYFSPDGKSMRKSFLKAPLKYTRISSRFSLHRMHPILGYTRAHRGVDYAAPIGTPVHAVGDGVITYCGWRGGYGRFIVIHHTDGIHSTAYAHLSRYARGIHSGVHVHQGQVIAFVGMSGLATGPHLHFEFRIRGVKVNPLTVKRTPAEPVPSVKMAAFRQQTAPLLARIAMQQPLLAWN